MDNKLTIKNDSKSRRGFLQDLTKWIGGTALLAATANVFTSNKIKAGPDSVNSTEPFIGEIIMFGGNFAPRGWALCDGQLIPVSSNDALFSILGTTYGGDGRTTFGLPDMRSRVPIRPGTGSGLSTYRLGQRGGTETVTLNTSQIPAHNHTASLKVTAEGGNSDDPSGKFIASNSEGIKHYKGPTNPGVLSDAGAGSVAVNNAGGNGSHSNIQPYLTVNFIIALVGTFPSRN